MNANMIATLSLILTALSFAYGRVSASKKARKDELKEVRVEANDLRDELKEQLEELRKRSEKCENERDTLLRENVEIMRRLSAVERRPPHR